MPQARKTERRLHSVTIKLSEAEFERVRMTAETYGYRTSVFVRRLALNETAALRRVRPVPEVNRKLYLKLGTLQELLEERKDDDWGNEESKYLEEAIALLRSVQRQLAGIGGKEIPERNRNSE